MNPVFDIPALFGKTTDELVSLLGAPEQIPNDVTSGEQESYPEKDFKKGDWLLHVVFENPSKPAVEFMLVDESEAQGKSQADVLQAGNLKQVDPRYSTRFMSISRHPVPMQAVKINPKP